MSSPTPPQLGLLRQLPPGALRGHFWRRREGPRHGYVRGQNGAMKPGKLLLSAACLQVELDSVACGAALVPGQWAQASAVLVGMHQERSPGPRLPAPEGPRCLVSQCEDVCASSLQLSAFLGFVLVQKESLQPTLGAYATVLNAGNVSWKSLGSASSLPAS